MRVKRQVLLVCGHWSSPLRSDELDSIYDVGFGRCGTRQQPCAGTEQEVTPTYRCGSNVMDATRRRPKAPRDSRPQHGDNQ